VRFTRVRSAVLAATAACGIAAGAMAAIPAAQAARPSAGRVVIVTCAGKGVTSPSTYIIACADANDYLKGLNWSSWGVPASGFGKDVINDCIPTCVAGKFHSYRVKVSLWRPEPWRHHGHLRYFSRMTLTYTRAIPRGFHRTRVIDLLP